ncbi:MAG: putative 4-hydroxybenzoate polyprenyltransferase, partial [Candidatus Sumerlaeaceae bacterium]|nr:putative 4-hydroxybenzoate polyprenyltransferase [Candidatus Sumerlaeaceae bacterium]
MKAALKSTGIVLEMIKFQHTLFALPFALAGAILAAGGLPDARTFLWIIAACVFARTAAMSFNRWADAGLDARNPRTATRAIPAGQLSGGFVLCFALINAALFVWAAAMLNSLAFYLSPVALVVLLGYSYTKRFTWMAHFVLGLALGIAPIGAWIAVRGSLSIEPLLMGLAVLVWTAGFDLIYACQDIEVDSREGLYSIPSRFGAKLALRWSGCRHIAC